jgi:mRNA-degrading endonuclease RelE of RelBE toxin-antitoxin system
MRFVETPVFTVALQRHLDDEHYRRLQIALMLRPEQGPIIRGSGGLRKVRWAKAGAGKRGGLRIIYYWAPVERAFYMLYAYIKTEQGDLTPAQTRVLGRLVREEFK